MLDRVKNKLSEEMKEKLKSRKAEAIRPSVYEKLLDFSEQSEEFAQAILDAEKTVNDCCEDCVKGCGSSISDIKVYRKMAQFYFPGSDVEMSLTINLSADAEKSPLSSYKKKAVIIDLFDMFGGD